MVSRGKVGNSQHFPTNLHILLDEADKGNHSHIVSWCTQGHSFKIHDQDALVPLLAKYFRQTKFKSFLRQLQSYGFHRTTRGIDKGLVSHPYFVRGRRSLCFRMTRKHPGGAANSAAACAIARHSGIGQPHQMPSSPSMVYQVAALPSNSIAPLRKTYSAPMFKQSFKGGFQPNGETRSAPTILENNMQWNGRFMELSKLKNESFGYQRNASTKNYSLVDTVSSTAPSIRASSTGVFYAVSSQEEKIPPSSRRTSEPSIVLSSTQRDNILKCAEIDYRFEPSPIDTRASVPRESIRLSIKESSPTTNQVSSPQQVLFQVQPRQHQEILPKGLRQGQGQVQQVQLTEEPQNLVHTQRTQYHQEQEPYHQVHVQYQAHPERLSTIQYKQEQQHQIPLQHNPDIKPGAEQVYSHQQVEEKLKQARQEMAKHFRDQYKLQEQDRLYYPSDASRDSHHFQQQQQQVFQQVVQQPTPPQQECKQAYQVQPHFLQQNEKVLPTTHVQYHQVQTNRLDPQSLEFIATPRSGIGVLEGSSDQCANPNHHKSVDHFAGLAENFKLSFSTKFNHGSAGKEDTSVFHSVEAPTHVSSNHASAVSNNASSFSVAISTQNLSELPSMYGFSTKKSTMPLPRCSTSDTHKRVIQPISIELAPQPHQRTHTEAAGNLSLQQQQQQYDVSPARAVSAQQHEAKSCDVSDEGTVDFLLQHGSGGCEEWGETPDMKAEEVVEGLNYYGFLNSTDNGDPCLSESQVYRSNHSSNPVPDFSGVVSSSPNRQ